MKKLSLVLVAFVSLVFQNAFADEKIEPQGQLVETVTLSDEATEEIVAKAVVQAALGRKWNIEGKDEGILKISLKQRGYDSTLFLVYNAKKVDIYSDSWAVNKKGERKKEKHPDGWIANIAKDIRVFVDREIYMP